MEKNKTTLQGIIAKLKTLFASDTNSGLQYDVLEVGAAVNMMDASGAIDPAPDGSYTLDDGTVIDVVDGKISAITPVSSDNGTDVNAADETTTEDPKIAELEKRVTTLEGIVEKLQSAATQDAETNLKFSKDVESLTGALKLLAGIPVGKAANQSNFGADAEAEKKKGFDSFAASLSDDE